MNTISMNHSAANVVTCVTFCLKQLTKRIAKMKCEHWIERSNWSSCIKLAMSASLTHGLIAQSVGASERNSQNEMWTQNREIKLELLYRVGYECKFNSWPNSSVSWSIWAELSGCGFRSHSGQLCIASSKNLSVMNTTCINHFAANVITCARVCIKQMLRWTKGIAKMKCDHWREWWIWG